MSEEHNDYAAPKSTIPKVYAAIDLNALKEALKDHLRVEVRVVGNFYDGRTQIVLLWDDEVLNVKDLG